MRVIRFTIVALMLAVAAGQAQASLVMTMVESGSDVVVSGGGTVNTAGLTGPSSSGVGGAAIDTQHFVVFGPAATFVANLHSGVSGPASIGPGSVFTIASSGSGDKFGIGFSGSLILPTGYVSGSSLTASSTYAGESLASLGVTPGTYTWTWGAGDNADSLQLQIGSTAVPEPTSLALTGFAGIGMAVGAWRRRRQQKA